MATNGAFIAESRPSVGRSHCVTYSTAAGACETDQGSGKRPSSRTKNAKAVDHVSAANGFA